jgi:hypothetical protein
MSSFNWSALQNLFGGSGGGGNPFAGLFGSNQGSGGAPYGGSQLGYNPNVTGYFNPATGGPAYAPSASFGQGGFSPYGSFPGMNAQRIQQVGAGGGGGPTYGELMQGALMSDFANAERARQTELGLYGGLFGNMQRATQQAGQQQLSALLGGLGQYRQDITGAAGAMRGMFESGQADYEKAMGMLGKAPQTAGSYFGKAIKTMEGAIDEREILRKDSSASIVAGLQNQYANQMNAIASDSNLSEEQRSMMRDELRMNMQQQTAGLVAQADKAAADSLLAARGSLSQLQASAGATIGGLQAQAGGAMGGLAMSRTGMGLEMESNIANMFSNFNQFSGSLMQSAYASAFQNQLQGNLAMAQILQQAPLGPVSLAEMIARQVQAVGARPGDMPGNYFMNLFGRS